MIHGFTRGSSRMRYVSAAKSSAYAALFRLWLITVQALRAQRQFIIFVFCSPFGALLIFGREWYSEAPGAAPCLDRSVLLYHVL